MSWRNVVSADTFFGGDAGDIHDKVIDRMFAVLEGESSPAYMDTVSLMMLEEARAHYEQLGFRANNMHSIGEHTSVIATRVGTVKTSTLALALRSQGFSVEQHDGFLMVQTGDETPDLRSVLADIRSGEPVGTEKLRPPRAHWGCALQHGGAAGAE